MENRQAAYYKNDGDTRFETDCKAGNSYNYQYAGQQYL